MPQDPEKEAMFAKVIESIYERHGSTLITMAKGAHELRTMLKHDVNAFADSNDIQERLDEFYMSRIGIRMVSVFLDVHAHRARAFDDGTLSLPKCVVGIS